MWSVFAPFLVVPAAPVPVSPGNGSVVTVKPYARLTFKWINGEGSQAKKCTLTIHGGKAPICLSVDGNEAQIASLAPGEYKWRVAPVAKTGEASGSYFYRATTSLGSESMRPAFAGLAVAGWAFRPFAGGLTFGASAGVHYVAAPNVSVVTFNAVGVNPVGIAFLGYAF